MRRHSIKQYFDFPLMGIAGFLIGAGMLILYSSIYMGGGGEHMQVFWRQILWFGLGLIVLAISIFTPLKTFRRISYAAWGVSLLLLAMVLFVGSVRGGAGRWISILGFQMQPSELAKLTTILAMARYLG